MASTPITTGLIPQIAPQRLAKPLRIALFALVVLALELLLARGVSGPQISKIVLLLVGLYAVAFVFRFPMATALIFLALTDFVFYPTYFSYQLGPVTARPHEFALLGLLVLAVLRPKRDTFGGLTGQALAAFLAIVALSAAVAYMKGAVSLTEAFNWGRSLFALTFFWVVIRLFPSSEDRRALLLGTAVIAALAGVVALMVALGAGFGDSLQGPGGQTIKEEGGLGSLKRVRLAGLSAGYALFWYVAVQAAARVGRPRLGWGLVLGGIIIGVAVSLNRNMWIGLALGLVLIAVVGGSLIRSRVLAGVGIVIAAGVLFFAFGSASSSDQITEPLIERGSTLLDPGKTSQESSLQERGAETETALKTITEKPLLGVGVGAPFGVNTRAIVYSGERIVGFKTEPQLFLHNQYLYLLLIGGIPCLVAFLLFLGSAVSLSWRREPRDPAIASLGVGIVLVMVSAVVAIYFTVDDMTAILGLLTGVIVADAAGRARQGKRSGLTVVESVGPAR